MSAPTVNLSSLTPGEFMAYVEDGCYVPPSRAVMEELLSRYAALVDADIERANAEDAAAALAATRMGPVWWQITPLPTIHPQNEYILRCGAQWRPYVFTVGPGDYRVRFTHALLP